MLKRTTLSLASLLILFPPSAFCTIENDIDKIDTQRNEMLKQVTTGLVSGRISIDDAKKLKGELDNIVKLEDKAKEDPLTSPEALQNITGNLQTIRTEIDASTHPTKIWLGIDSRDNTLERKITEALDKKAISKEQAESFKLQFDELRERESNGDPSRGMEFDDAMSLAADIQTFDVNLDKAIAGK